MLDECYNMTGNYEEQIGGDGGNVMALVQEFTSVEGIFDTGSKDEDTMNRPVVCGLRSPPRC